jgi:hypothetical protein
MAPLRPKFYFLAPTTTSPVDGPMFLGAIITHPRDADRPLNDPPVRMDPSIPVYESEINSYTVTIGKERSVSMGIWASFLAYVFGVGGSIDGTISTGDDETWEIGKLRTISFEPSLEYIQSSLESSKVQKFLAEDPNWLWSSRLYMITGLKLAYDAKGAVSWAKSRGLNLQPGLDATLFGVPAEIGPHVGISHRNHVQQSYGEMSPFVLAFRMQRLKVTSAGEIETTPVTGGMLRLGDSKDSSPSSTGKRPAYVIEGLDPDDAGAEEFHLDHSWEVEDETEANVETCKCSLVH